MSSAAGASRLGAVLEGWYRDYLPQAAFDISSSGVQPYALHEVCSLTGLSLDELDDVVLDDSTTYGAPRLRQAIAARYAPGRADWVMPTHGSSEAIALALSSLLEPGDRVVVIGPAYHALHDHPVVRGCEVVEVPVDAVAGESFDADRLARALGAGARALIANFPHNPTGMTVTEERQRALVDAAADAGAVFVWDGAMAELALDGEPLPEPVAYADNAVSFGTLSKAFGLPGLRVGWWMAPPDLLDAAVPLRDRTTLFLSPLIELIAAYAIENAEKLIRPRLDQACRNLARLESWMDGHPRLSWERPRGGVCALVRVAGVDDSEAFCGRLVAETGVLLVPGTAFGVEGAVRLGFGGDEKAFARALDVLSDFLGG